MVFEADYEIDFEIYERRRDCWNACGQLLGHMVGSDAEDAKARWAETYGLSLERQNEIIALSLARK